MNALLLEDGTELDMNLLDANMLNSYGVVTALNWIGGWKSWGNRTACYPGVTDVKDMFIPVRRTFDYVGNTIVLTIWQKVDEPGNRRLIDAIVNSLQMRTRPRRSSTVTTCFTFTSRFQLRLSGWTSRSNTGCLTSPTCGKVAR